MRTLMLTGHDKAYAPLARLTVPLMFRYATLWDLDFECRTEPYEDVPNGIYWVGLHGAIEALRSGYDRVFYLDVDQAVTNAQWEPPPWPSGLHVSKDWGNDAVEPWHFSTCGFIAHQDSLPLLYEVATMEPAWRDKPFPFQGPLRDAVRRKVDGLKLKPDPIATVGMINVHPRKMFNCVPFQVCPGSVPEPWEPGDFCAHLTMLPLAGRVKLFHELKR